MSVKPITAVELAAAKNKNQHAEQGGKSQSAPSFQGLECVPIAVADAIYNGGFMFSFVAQDGFGMALPRVAEGINRRSVNPETGKKEGPYNWAFARREGIREILSGPSAFLIPSAILYFVKKYSGQANNVPVNMIQGLGANFVNYAAVNPHTLNDVVKTKREFYQGVFKNVLNTTLKGQLEEGELNDLSKSYMLRAIEIENAKDNKKSLLQKITGKKVEGSPEDLTDSLQRHFMSLKKKYLDSSVNELSAELTINPEKIGKYGAEIAESDKNGVEFKKLLKTMADFTDDVINSVGEKLKKSEKNLDTEEIQNFLKKFVSRRTGSRIITNIGMWSAVVGFYALIPHLYSAGLGHKNPAFMTEKAEPDTKDKINKTGTESDEVSPDKKEVAFCGKHELFAKTADKVVNSGKIKKFLSNLEFDDASMSLPAMSTLLFGFCLPTRLWKSRGVDKYDFNETLVRDVTSFSAILFAANAIAKGFSNMFAKFSGLALNVKPANHNESFLNKFKNYFSLTGGINVLNNSQLDSKYTNIHQYRDGINGFFDFVSNNGGNLKKLLQLDADVAKNSEIILGKSIKDATNDEIKDAFKNITSEKAKKALQVIENVFKDSKNKFVKQAKIYNSMFTFMSTIFIVPAFMIWLARTCDKMTRKARAKDNTSEFGNVKPGTSVPEPTSQKQPSFKAGAYPIRNITMQSFLSR